MPRSATFLSRARRRLAQILAPRPSEIYANRTYYEQQATCQIPNLSLLYSRFLGEKVEGTFIEVGGYDGIFASNTWGLARRGWNGLLFEPVPSLAALCALNHQEHLNVNVVQMAVANPGVDFVNLYLAGTLTTAVQEVNSEYSQVDWASGSLTNQTIRVPCSTLDLLLPQYGISPNFDVLVVDVEGFESSVFAGFDLTTWQPKILIVELADTHPDLTSTATTDAHLSSNIEQAGYKIIYKDWINTVFVRIDVWSSVYSTTIQNHHN